MLKMLFGCSAPAVLENMQTKRKKQTLNSEAQKLPEWIGFSLGKKALP